MAAANSVAVVGFGIKEAVKDAEVKTVYKNTVEKVQLYSLEAVIALGIMASLMVFFCFALVYFKIKRNNKHTYTHRAATAALAESVA